MIYVSGRNDNKEIELQRLKREEEDRARLVEVERMIQEEHR